METRDLDTETYETIPWTQLTPARTSPAQRTLYLLGGLVVAAVLGFLLLNVLRDDAPRTVVTVPVGEAVAPEPLPTSAAVVPIDEPTVAADPVRLYSEADLMAVIPEEEQRAAAVIAAWFVTDFFTVDGDAATAASLRSLLPAGLEVPLPHDAAGAVSYVEWAEAIAVQPDGPGRYLVDVAFRAIDGSGDGTVRRRPVRAVRLRIGTDGTGTPSVLDLPQPIEFAPGTVPFTEPPRADPPPEVLAAAYEAAAPFGRDATAIATGLDVEGWRVVLLITDRSGLQFPLVVRP